MKSGRLGQEPPQEPGNIRATVSDGRIVGETYDEWAARTGRSQRQRQIGQVRPLEDQRPEYPETTRVV